MPFSFDYQSFPQDHMTPRIGRITTPHGTIETPAFIFCATKGAIKGLSVEEMETEGTQIILANTYHLMLQPGAEIIQTLGGLGKMMGWSHPTLTDSGGYQIFSMGYGSVAEEIKGNRKQIYSKSSVKITEDGACFKSYLNGETILLTPERSIEQQEQIGADLIVAFDECTPYHIERDYTAQSMHRSHRWEKRSLMRFLELETQKPSSTLPQALYGVIQGGVYEDLRQESSEFINDQAFFGQAIGGSLGATQEQMDHIVSFTMQHLRKDRPIHLLGIGKIRDIFNGVALGIDTFDCVHPTRIARHGCALVKPEDKYQLHHDSNKEHINLKNQQFAKMTAPISLTCRCLTCQKYSCGYIHHLLKSQEMLGVMLLARHNVHFMNELMKAIRIGIQTQKLNEIQKEWYALS